MCVTYTIQCRNSFGVFRTFSCTKEWHQICHVNASLLFLFVCVCACVCNYSVLCCSSSDAFTHQKVDRFFQIDYTIFAFVYIFIIKKIVNSVCTMLGCTVHTYIHYALEYNVSRRQTLLSLLNGFTIDYNSFAKNPSNLVHIY